MMTVNSAQRGATLIEVLVSLIILAGGVLGVSALLTTGLRVNMASYLRTQAVVYSQDLTERMRANAAGVQAGDYDNPVAALTANCLQPAGCSAAQMAAHDVSEWTTLLATNLPAGTGLVCIDSDPTGATPAAPGCDGVGEIHAIHIWWDDDRDGVAEQSIVSSFQP
ncbi:MAG: type IV pilus modification protein PilV [Gammaproteobacteria bacterium]